MTDNYWQFQQTMVDTAPLMLQQQQQISLPQPTQQQHAWSDDTDKRKWGQSFDDFDMTTDTSKMFRKYYL